MPAEPMGGLHAQQVALLVSAGLFGGLVFGATGFAFGVIASLFLHHAFVPKDVVFIIVVGGLILNLCALPKYYRLMSASLAMPFIAGAMLGLPLGVLTLELLNPVSIRALVAALILCYCVFGLIRQRSGALALNGTRGRIADASIGLAGGVVGGVAGLGPLVPGVWYGLRGWTRDQQRGLAQAFGVFIQGALVIWLASSGRPSPLALVGVGTAMPAMLVGAWLGTLVFARIGVAGFQRIVILLCALGAAALLIRQWV